MELQKSITTTNAQETKEVGRALAQDVLEKKKGERAPLRQGFAGQATVVCLYGELGSGKTTFVQGFAKGLGIEKRLLSPTFIIVRRYSFNTNKFLYHLDLYRLKTMEEVGQLGLEEIFADPHAFVFVEWAEKLGSMLPDRRIDVHCSVLEGGIHRIDIQKYGTD